MHLSLVQRSRNLQIASGVLLSALVGALFPLQPIISLVLVLGLIMFTLMLVSEMTLRALSLGLILVTVFGYLFVGRGFAYIGLGPVYVGEISLLAALVVAVTSKSQRRAVIPIVTAAVFIFFGVLGTLPFLGTYGMLAIRDAALYYYALFAILLYFSLSESEVRSGLKIIGEAIPFYLIWSFIQLGNDVTGVLPNLQWPGAPVGFFVTKPGDRAVVLAAIAAYVLLGLPKLLGVRRTVPWVVFWSSWIGLAAVAAIGARGGMLALAVAICVAIGYRRSREVLRMVVIGCTVVLLMTAWNPSIKIGSYREMSVDQFAVNLTSIFLIASEDSGGVNQNRDWRLDFWASIVDDTVRTDKRWLGKGYGANLASEAGFQVSADAELRSPHNVFVTVLGRMGTVGLVLWIWLIASFFNVLQRTAIHARRAGDEVTPAVMVFGLAYAGAALMNASFDVYLEGPQGAIPFWCAFGAILVLAEPVLRRKEISSETPDVYSGTN